MLSVSMNNSLSDDFISSVKIRVNRKTAYNKI